MFYYKEVKDGKIIMFCECSQPQTDKIEITKEEYEELASKSLSNEERPNDE